MQDDQRFNKWCEWIESINTQVQLLLLYRCIFTEVSTIVESNPAIDRDNFYFGFVSNAYVDSLVMGIRRQLKVKKESISLARLMNELADYPQLITRSVFETQYFRDVSPAIRAAQDKPSIRGAMENAFAKFAEPSAQHIDSNRIKFDLSVLKAICNTAEDYADKRVAHWDIKHPTSNLTYNDINESLNQLRDMVQKYYLLLLGSHMFMNPALPKPISEIFQRAWVNSDTRIQELRK